MRRHIEAACPPLQIYATTGKNWQTTLIRHIPIIEACSTCLFPNQLPPKPTACATATVGGATMQEEPKVDAAVPFLSFAAGFATAVEFFKISLWGYPFYAQRVAITFAPSFQIDHFDLPRRPDCTCSARDAATHLAALGNSPIRELTTNSSSRLRSVQTAQA